MAGYSFTNLGTALSSMKRFAFIFSWLIPLYLSVLAADSPAKFSSIQLGSTTNLYSDSGPRPTYNGTNLALLSYQSAGVVSLFPGMSNIFRLVWNDNDAPTTSTNHGIFIVNGGAGLPTMVNDTGWTILIGDSAGAQAVFDNTDDTEGMGSYAFRLSSLKDTLDMFGLGDRVFVLAKITNSFWVSMWGSDAASQATITASEQLQGIGQGAFFLTYATNSSYLDAFGSEAFSFAILDGVDNVLAVGEKAFREARLTNVTDVLAIGKTVGQSITLSGKTHMAMIGTGAVATNSNDFVLGDSANNYKFPGASADFAGPITAKISVTASPGTDDTYQGTQITGLNNSGGVTQWDTVYLNSSSQWVLADANGTGTYPARGIASATVATANATTVITSGTIRNDAWNWTPGGTIYLSTTPGGLTQTAPSTTGDKVQVIGYALTADIMAVAISPDYGTAP